jgi:chloramphenicol 3-O phosphotransferase
VFDADAASRLFRALLTHDSIDGLVAAEGDPAAVSSALDQLRTHRDLHVVSVAVNGRRVDVIARHGDEEWRVVFGSDDGTAVAWLSVFRRPPPFDGVVGGRAIVVNGPSSAGKSTLLREIQARSDDPWVVLDEPMFGAVAQRYLIWRDRYDVLHRGFVDGIAALARAGNLVAVAAGGHPQSLFDASFAGIPMIRVGLHCDADVLDRRELGRDDVAGGLARGSLDVHHGWQYDLTFDTGTRRVDDMATTVLAAFAALADPA